MPLPCRMYLNVNYSNRNRLNIPEPIDLFAYFISCLSYENITLMKIDKDLSMN